jgi:trehalose transport system substrate-binding protein
MTKAACRPSLSSSSLPLFWGPRRGAPIGTPLIPSLLPNRELALEFMRYLMSKPVQKSLVSALGWPSFRSDAYGTIESWQTPYFAAVQEALRLAHPKPHVPNWAEVGRALSGAFREIVYEGQPVQAALDRYHRQLQQVQKRLK